MITFFAWVLLQLFHRIRNQHQILRFFIPICIKTFVLIILALWKNFEETNADQTEETENLSVQMCLRIKFCNHQRPGRTNLLKSLWFYLNKLTPKGSTNYKDDLLGTPFCLSLVGYMQFALGSIKRAFSKWNAKSKRKNGVLSIFLGNFSKISFFWFWKLSGIVVCRPSEVTFVFVLQSPSLHK